MLTRANEEQLLWKETSQADKKQVYIFLVESAIIFLNLKSTHYIGLTKIVKSRGKRQQSFVC